MLIRSISTLALASISVLDVEQTTKNEYLGVHNGCYRRTRQRNVYSPRRMLSAIFALYLQLYMNTPLPTESPQPSTIMLSTPSTGLMFGLGLRLILHKLNASRPISLLLLNSLWGACQGILVCEVFLTAPSFAFITSAGLATRLFLHLVINRQFDLFVRQLLGAVLGFLLSAVINQVAQETGLYSPAPKNKSRPSRSKQTWRERLGIPHIALDAISEEDSDLSSVAKEMAQKIQGSEIGTQISSLRAQADAAAGDKRRIQEERKWAISQGNWARASQLGLQIRRYQALIESFAKEARRRKSEGGFSFLFVNI